MIRQGGGEGIKHVGVKAHIPIGVAIESIKLAKRWIFSLITPSEVPILKVNFMNLTSLKGVPKAIDAATVCIGLGLVTSPTDLVEVPED
jgi:hypothetical protein